MITAAVQGDAAVVIRLRRVGTEVDSAAKASIGRLALRLQANVMSKKLTGQVLKVRTGTLRRSITQAVVSDGQSVTGVVSTNVVYAAKHEYGFNGAETVKAHLRKVKMAWGKPLKTPVMANVGSFTRNVKYPPRSFLRSALRELEPAVQAEFSQSLKAAIK